MSFYKMRQSRGNFQHCALTKTAFRIEFNLVSYVEKFLFTKMNVQQPFLIPWMGQMAAAAAQQQQQQQQQQLNGAQQQPVHPQQLQLQSLQKAQNSLQLAQISALQQQYSSALQHAAAVAAAAAANQPGAGQHVSLPALAAAAAAAAQQQPTSVSQQQTQQQAQQAAQQMLYQNVHAVQPNSANLQMAQMAGMAPGLLQTPTAVSSSLHTPQQFLAAAAASPQYSTVQKILIPGSKVSKRHLICISRLFGPQISKVATRQQFVNI